MARREQKGLSGLTSRKITPAIGQAEPMSFQSGAGVPLLRLGGNAPSKLEHVGVGAAGRTDLLQFFVGGGKLAQDHPALGSFKVEGIGRL